MYSTPSYRMADAAMFADVTENKICKSINFTPEEDEQLRCLAQKYGAKWQYIAQILNTTFSPTTQKTGKQCRERFLNHVDPTLDKSPFTEEEEEALIQLHSSVYAECGGSKWAEITKRFPCTARGRRAENDIKNIFNSAGRNKDAKKISTMQHGSLKLREYVRDFDRRCGKPACRRRRISKSSRGRITKRKGVPSGSRRESAVHVSPPASVTTSEVTPTDDLQWDSQTADGDDSEGHGQTEVESMPEHQWNTELIGPKDDSMDLLLPTGLLDDDLDDLFQQSEGDNQLDFLTGDPSLGPLSCLVEGAARAIVDDLYSKCGIIGQLPCTELPMSPSESLLSAVSPLLTRDEPLWADSFLSSTGACVIRTGNTPTKEAPLHYDINEYGEKLGRDSLTSINSCDDIALLEGIQFGDTPLQAMNAFQLLTFSAPDRGQFYEVSFQTGFPLCIPFPDENKQASVMCSHAGTLPVVARLASQGLDIPTIQSNLAGQISELSANVDQALGFLWRGKVTITIRPEYVYSTDLSIIVSVETENSQSTHLVGNAILSWFQRL